MFSVDLIQLHLISPEKLDPSIKLLPEATQQDLIVSISRMKLIYKGEAEQRTRNCPLFLNPIIEKVEHATKFTTADR